MSQCPGIMIWLNPAPVLVHTPSDLNNIDAHALLMVLRTFFVRQCQDSFPKGLLNRKVCAPVPRCGLKCCSLKWKTCVCMDVCMCVYVCHALYSLLSTAFWHRSNVVRTQLSGDGDIAIETDEWPKENTTTVDRYYGCCEVESGRKARRVGLLWNSDNPNGFTASASEEVLNRSSGLKRGHSFSRFRHREHGEHFLGMGYGREVMRCWWMRIRIMNSTSMMLQLFYLQRESFPISECEPLQQTGSRSVRVS